MSELNTDHTGHRIEVDLNGVNDFRDWKSIEEFADNFSALLVDIN